MREYQEITDKNIGYYCRIGLPFLRDSKWKFNFAHRLYDALQDRGVRCWLRERPMLPGEDLDEGFDLGPRDFDRLVLCCSRASLSSWWLAAELDLVAGRPEVLQPIDLGGAAPAWEQTRASRKLPPTVADFGGWEGDERVFGRGLDPLVAALGGAA